MKYFEITAPDDSMRAVLQEKIDSLNKPKGALGRLEELALQIALIQQTAEPILNRPYHILFGADHGIEHEGVSVSPREVTWQQMVNFTQGGGGINLFCRQHGVKLRIVDMGVDYDLMPYPGIINRKIERGTRNFLYEAAMTTGEMVKALEAGARQVTECNDEGCNVFSFGEMGIANTSPSSIWMHLLTDTPLSECVGAGAGLNDEGVSHKLAILTEAVARFNAVLPSGMGREHYLYEVMRYFGGFEMVAAIGAMLRAAELHAVILVDGFIMSACMLVASQLYPEILPYAIFCHVGDEMGHKRLLDKMQVKGLINLGLRLGEGTGALCAYPLVSSAVRMLSEMNTFEEAKITRYF